MRGTQEAKSPEMQQNARFAHYAKNAKKQLKQDLQAM